MSNNLTNSSESNNTIVFNFRLKVMDRKTIKNTYEELIAQLLESFNNEEILNNKKRRENIELMIKENKKSKLTDNLKIGIPHSLRRRIYLFLMGVDPNSMENSIRVDDNTLLVDYLIIEDLKEAVSSENYFLFEENLKCVIQTLIRDKDVISEIQGVRPIILILFNDNNNTNNKLGVPYPASGLIPFKGLAFQISTLCYLSTNLVELYTVVKYFFCKYLSYLSSYTTNKNSILSSRPTSQHSTPSPLSDFSWPPAHSPSRLYTHFYQRHLSASSPLFHSDIWSHRF